MQVQFIYCQNIYSMEQLQQHLALLLRFPAHYGQNLDALHDCLSELASPLQLIVKEKSSLIQQLGDEGSRFFRVLEDSAAENPSFQLIYK